MHKKPLIAVLALGLFLLTTVAASAVVAPPSDPDKVFMKGGHPAQTKGTPTVEAASAEPLVTVNAGTNRTVPGTFCSGQWQGAYAYSVGNWYGGNEFYAAYQDPANPAWFGGVCAPTAPSFDVTAINFILRKSAGTFPKTFQFQPLVFGVSSTAECAVAPAPVAGGALCTGSLFNVTWTAAATFQINLPFSIECCQSGAYFAAWYGPSPGFGEIRIGCDAGLPAPAGPTCGTFNEYGSGWDELSKYFTWGAPGPYNLQHILFSEGFTPNDIATHCTPGICDYQWSYVGSPSDCVTGTPGTRQNDCWFSGWVIPDAPGGTNHGMEELWTRFQGIGRDTLNAMAVGLYIWNGTPTMRVKVYAADNVNKSCGQAVPGALLGFVDVPFAALTEYPVATYVDLSSIPLANRVFGTLNGGAPPVDFFISVSVSPLTPDPVNDALYIIFGDVQQDFVNPICKPDPRSGAYFSNFDGLGPKYLYHGQYTIIRGATPTPRYRAANDWMDAFICKEKVPIVETNCSAPGPDNWPAFAHDFRHTSASTINVGDPNGIKYEWSALLPLTCDFTTPTVANGRVYVSFAKGVQCYDLATSALLGEFTNAMFGTIMGSANRGHTTVDAAGNVYLTGGSLKSITKASGLLGAGSIIWSNNLSYRTCATGSALSDQNRFNSSVVATVGTTDLLFLTTEPTSGVGRLYAFEAATGCLYTGWATNPIVLDQAAKHGPAFDGTTLFVGTAVGGTNVGPATLYSIDAATGVINWTFVDIATEGWPGGVSLEGNFIYGQTKAPAPNNNGHRYKIDKTVPPVPGVPPTLPASAIVWKSVQGASLYSPPTIGRGFAYFPQDNPALGVIMVDKITGLSVHNFAAEGIGMVPMTATLSCDKYLFAGDRSAKWWLFNTTPQKAEWYRQFPAAGGANIVYGTALASTGGADYAVLSTRDEGLGKGRVLVYRLNTGPRPRMIQHVFADTISIPLNSGSGIPHTKTGVFSNIGNWPLTFSTALPSDVAPSAMAAAVRPLEINETRRSLLPLDANYNAYFTEATLTKDQRIAGLTTKEVDGEWMATDWAEISARSSVRNQTRMAAGAAAVRTGTIKLNGSPVPYALAAGYSADVSWEIDGTGLGRGLDGNQIAFDVDDPDFVVPPPSVANLYILYVGGCMETSKMLSFNAPPGGGGENKEKVFNYGALGWQNRSSASPDNWVFAADPAGTTAANYDGGMFVAYDSIAGAPGTGGALLRCAIYRYGATGSATNYGAKGMYVPNVNPVDNTCTIWNSGTIALGFYRSGGYPGTATVIDGMILKSAYSDTNIVATPGSRQSTIGLDIEQTEIGAFDTRYGDFKLVHWLYKNRDAVVKGPLYVGSWTDWDVPTGDAGNNTGLVSDNFNGYAIWNTNLATYAYGHLDVALGSTYSGVDPTVNSPYRIEVQDNSDIQNNRGWPFADTGMVWFDIVKNLPLRNVTTNISDKAGLLIAKPFTLAASGTHTVDFAVFGVNASSANPVIIEANCKDVAKRAAKWAGFARGDVNDDGFVDLADVVWLNKYVNPGTDPQPQLYPDTYCGDLDGVPGINMGDVNRLFNYVSAVPGNNPLGAWRF